MKSVGGTDQLGGDTESPSGLANTSFEDIGDTQRFPNGSQIDILTLEGER